MQMCNLSGMYWSWAPAVQWEHINTHKSPLTRTPTSKQVLHIVHLHSHDASATPIKYLIFSIVAPLRKQTKCKSSVEKGVSCYVLGHHTSIECKNWINSQYWKLPMIAFWFWQGLSPPGSDRTLGCTCKHTSSRALSSGLSRQHPAEGGSLPVSCRQRASVTDKRLETNIDTELLSSHFGLMCNTLLELVQG